MVPLVVILGAGASLGSGDYSKEPRPPLTVDLFNEAKYGGLLRDYALAHQAGGYIKRERASNTAIALEELLHRLRTSAHDHYRHYALGVPLYLQHLLHAVSDAHYTDAFRYDHLIEQVLQLPYVCFITLNYDLLLDRRLNSHHHLSTLDDYISQDKKWSLIKLHGSVNWFHKTSVIYSPQLPPADLQWDSQSFQCVAPNANLETILGARIGHQTNRYPALALPEGPDDRLVLPKEHAAFVRSTLRMDKEVDLLVIGYSGLDKEVLNLLTGAERQIRRMTVVGRDHDDAITVFDRFRHVGMDPLLPDVATGDFQEWADNGGPNKLVQEYDEPNP